MFKDKPEYWLLASYIPQVNSNNNKLLYNRKLQQCLESLQTMHSTTSGAASKRFSA